MNAPGLLYNIAITLVPNIGDVLAKKLVAYCGSAEEVFRQKKQTLLKIPGIGEFAASSVLKEPLLQRAEEEMRFMERYGVQALFYTDKEYPYRLKHCNDSPAMLYYKGSARLNESKMLNIVGTRRATAYGKKITEQIVAGLVSQGITIVSGLAYGIDVTAHKAALDNGLPTIGVVAHGLDMIYPSAHSNLAKKIEKEGGLLTEFMSNTRPDKENFPKRNRIVAGMTDATIVIESAANGGSLITAGIANSYNRDVFAVPGRAGDEFSEGCNLLIQHNRAALVHSASDILKLMGWEEEQAGTKKQKVQKELFVEFSSEEQQLMDLLKARGNPMSIDDICFASGLNPSKIAGLLLNLEFSGAVRPLPGKMYEPG